MVAVDLSQEFQMTLQCWIRRSMPAAAVLLAGAAPVVLAQGQELFEWRGRVDREVQVVMRGRNVWTNRIGQTEPGRARIREVSALPRQNGEIAVQVLEGRGSVDVIQQPSAQNGYTTIVRIVDPRSGSDSYRLAAYWQSYSNGEYVGKNRGRGRGRGQDRDNDDRGDIYRDRDRDGDNGGYDNGQYGRRGNQYMLHWSGNVDGELEVRIQNGRIDYRTLNGAEPTSIRADRANLNAPRTNATVAIVQNQGRGTVTVIQQPASWNGYTTVIRVRDPQGGYGFYDFDLMWQ
jgi:hypothetical protein